MRFEKGRKFRESQQFSEIRTRPYSTGQNYNTKTCCNKVKTETWSGRFQKRRFFKKTRQNSMHFGVDVHYLRFTVDHHATLYLVDDQFGYFDVLAAFNRGFVQVDLVYFELSVFVAEYF
jgi:hypothetical protein